MRQCWDCVVKHSLHSHMYYMYLAINNFPMYTGNGTFGVVLLAKAEGIVTDAPDKNIVAVKTRKGMYFFP